MAALRNYTSFEPSLRVLALLAIVGKLTEQQKRAMVALLGGVPPSTSADVDNTLDALRISSATAAAAHDSNHTDCIVNNQSSSSSCNINAASLPLPEPSSLAAARQEDGFSLQDLAVHFCFITTTMPYVIQIPWPITCCWPLVQLSYLMWPSCRRPAYHRAWRGQGGVMCSYCRTRFRWL
jgi:hypothetical protein